MTADPAEGIQDADVVATAVWNTAKPGTPESEQRLRDFVGYQLTGKLLESAKPDVMVLHCLPAHRGEEISSAVFEQHAPEIFDEARTACTCRKPCWPFCWRGNKNRTPTGPPHIVCAAALFFIVGDLLME